VIDLVSDDFGSLKQSKLSANDRAKLDMHLTIIRELETSMPIPPPMTDGGTPTQVTSCGLSAQRTAQIQALNGDNSVSSDANFEKIGQMHMDILSLAVACNHTVAGSLLFGRGSGGPVYKWLDSTMQYNHHPLSHRATSDAASGGIAATAEPQLLEIDRWHAQQLAYWMDRLDSYSEGAGTVLDNTAVLWINELSDGLGHDYHDLPIVIAGGLGGYLKQGQFINVKGSGGYLPHNMLLTTLMNGVGLPTTHFGAVGGNAKPGEVTAIKV
jgi:hypothetical protein